MKHPIFKMGVLKLKHGFKFKVYKWSPDFFLSKPIRFT